MSLCRLMLHDYKYGDGELYEKYPIGYDNYDLECGLAWARGLLSEGIKRDNWWDIDLRIFVLWCKHKLKKGK